MAFEQCVKNAIGCCRRKIVSGSYQTIFGRFHVVVLKEN